MKIPKKLKIGGHQFTVKEVKDYGAMGSTETRKNLITICEDAPQTQKESTLLHEIFHCINTTFGSDMVSHSLLDSFSEQLYQVLKDNKLLK